MDIYTYLKKDHRMVSDLMKQVLNTEISSKREALYNKIRDELELHAETEEETFYAALKKKGGKHLQEKEEHAQEEHDEIRKFLSEVDSAEVNSDEWLISFGQLKHAVEHHVEEEEGEIFQQARKVLSPSQATRLAKDMETLKQKKKIAAGQKKPAGLAGKLSSWAYGGK